MNSMGIDYAADHAEQERDRGLFVTWEGSEYSAIVSVPTLSRDWEGDGSGVNSIKLLSVSIRTCIISDAIKIGDKFTYSGEIYRISDMATDDDSLWYLFNCVGLTT